MNSLAFAPPLIVQTTFDVSLARSRRDTQSLLRPE